MSRIWQPVFFNNTLLFVLYLLVNGRHISTILMNSIDIRDYSYDDYISMLTAAFQDYSLFAATIEENIPMSGQEKIHDVFVNELSEIGLLDKVILLWKTAPIQS